jgi:hypothetical protein
MEEVRMWGNKSCWQDYEIWIHSSNDLTNFVAVNSFKNCTKSCKKSHECLVLWCMLNFSLFSIKNDGMKEKSKKGLTMKFEGNVWMSVINGEWFNSVFLILDSWVISKTFEINAETCN